jgi:hypothetical protein
VSAGAGPDTDPDTDRNASTNAGSNADPDAEPASPATSPATSPDVSRTDASGTPRKPLSWRAVKAKAGAQLKAFLMPAHESVDGDVVRLKYDAVHRFHHAQLLGRSDELAALVDEVAGPGHTILIEGPDGGAPKKIA